jgi:alcohol dehydrogenase (NADP+)
MPNTKAYAASVAKATLAPFSFDRRTPGDHDVAIEIKFCGICHTDVHQARDEWGGGIFPMVPGHEIAGVVTSVGSKVTKFKPGQHVGVGCIVDSCRHCVECREAEEQYCSTGAVFTYNGRDYEGNVTQGGYSDKIVVNEDFVLRIPDNLPLNASAPLLCAGITLYSPLKHWGAGPGKRIAIIGLGGLGHMGVKIAHALGAEVTVLSQSLKKQDDGKRLGADHFYATSDPQTFEKLKNSFDLIINTVPAANNWDQFIGLLATDGALVMVGVPDDAVAINGFPLIAKRRSVAGSMIGGIAETQEMLDFCGRHNIASDIELISIQQVNEAFDRVVKGDVRYRFVIDCSTL